MIARRPECAIATRESHIRQTVPAIDIRAATDVRGAVALAAEIVHHVAPGRDGPRAPGRAVEVAYLGSARRPGRDPYVVTGGAVNGADQRIGGEARVHRVPMAAVEMKQKARRREP